MTATDPTNIPDPDAPQGPGDEITTPEAHNHGGEPKVWCETCQHTHIASIPEVTYACHRCGFGSWHSETATEHESLCHGHETYPLGHVMRPVAPAPDHGAAGFCTDHGLPADRPTTVAEAVEALRLVLARGSYQMPGDTLPYLTQAHNVAEAVGYAALLDEVERLRAGIAHIVDRYGNAPGIETCATMYDLRRLVEGTP